MNLRMMQKQIMSGGIKLKIHVFYGFAIMQERGMLL